MVNCEVCGKRNDELVYALVEGVKLQVCFNCAKYGKFAGSVKREVFEARDERGTKKAEGREEESIVANFAELIRSKRDRLGLSQKVFAEKLSEKESFVAKLENGQAVLSIETAKKLERLLGISLVSKEKAVHLAGQKGKSSAFTIGDLMKKE